MRRNPLSQSTEASSVGVAGINGVLEATPAYVVQSTFCSQPQLHVVSISHPFHCRPPSSSLPALAFPLCCKGLRSPGLESIVADQVLAILQDVLASRQDQKDQKEVDAKKGYAVIHTPFQMFARWPGRRGRTRFSEKIDGASSSAFVVRFRAYEGET